MMLTEKLALEASLLYMVASRFTNTKKRVTIFLLFSDLTECQSIYRFNAAFIPFTYSFVKTY